MNKDLDQIKEGLLALYDEERLDAEKASDANRIGQLGKAVHCLGQMTTKSELLMNLRENALTLFQAVRHVEEMGAFLKDNFSVRDLSANDIYIDCLPDRQLTEGTDCLLINSRPHLIECDFSHNIHATFLGRWLVNAYEADIVALEGVHINLMDTVSTARCLGGNASAIRRQDTYFQGVLELNEVSFRELELLSRKMAPEALLEYVIQDGEDPSMPLNLVDVHAAATLEKGDQLIAENECFVLTRNALNRSYMLFQKRTEGEIIDYMRSATEAIPLNEDLVDLQACLMRETFMRLKNERLEIGRNYPGEPVTLSFDGLFRCYEPHNLYVRAGSGDWKAESSVIDMRPQLPLNSTIDRIKEKYSHVLQGTVEQQSGRSARR